ncbi:MAG: CDP-alcohol phosphatidyltransferase family protein [Clostridiales bacterium]|nr:CDP-alcohol phosphatidyltransferase family protein [Clostridiales bacterium]
MKSRPSKEINGIFTVPNLLSLLRIALIPLILWVYLKKQNALLTALLLLLSGATDIADGIIARKCNMTSDLGKALDPIADKLTQAFVLFCLINRYPLMLLPFILLFLKEMVVGLSSLEVIRRTGKVYGAVWHGKATTVFLYGVMLVHLFWQRVPVSVSRWLILLCAGMMLLSCALYLIRNHSLIRKADQAKNNDPA